MLNATTLTALTHPAKNASHVAPARVKAREEVRRQKEVISWLDVDDPLRKTIQSEVDAIKCLPGYTEPAK